MVSVIIPTYNGEKTITRAIESVLRQTEGTFEILVCDDLSTDKTIEIVMEYGCRVFINDVRTGGPNKGRNTGIENAKGDYIAFLDQDDEWLPFKIEEQLKQFHADFVYSRCIKKMG